MAGPLPFRWFFGPFRLPVFVCAAFGVRRRRWVWMEASLCSSHARVPDSCVVRTGSLKDEPGPHDLSKSGGDYLCIERWAVGSGEERPGLWPLLSLLSWAFVERTRGRRGCGRLSFRELL